MRGKRAKMLRKMAFDEFIDRVAKEKPDDNGIRRGQLRGLYHHPNQPRVAVNHPESFRGIYRIAKKIFKKRVAAGLPI